MQRIERIALKTFTGQVVLCSVGAIVAVFIVLTVIHFIELE